MIRLHLDHLDTPIGRLALVVDDAGRLHAAGFTDAHARMARQLEHFRAREEIELAETNDPVGVTEALRSYFDGDLRAIEALEVAANGTPFQQSTWTALREIPSGHTWSYAALAARIGRPSAVRAVGAANGANPVAIVVPCHRVIGSSGKLTGYGGGLERKRWLLAHESC